MNITETPEWAALEKHYAEISVATCGAVRRGSGPSAVVDRAGGGPVPRLLEESHHR